MSDVGGRLNSDLANRYRIEREIGRGGMAVVYLAEDLRHHRRVAVKVLNPELSAVLGVERFAREIDILASLSHPHILPLHDSGQAGGGLFYVMPFVEGESLRDRLNREKQLPLDDALRIAREVSDALSYAHQRGVVHRDIKPENILLQSGHAVVADFGIAKAISAAGGTKLTQTGVVVGTPTYMSPEAAMGDDGVDGRSDLYSIACVLYEMLTGRPPFVGPSMESIMRQHLTAEPPSVATLRPLIPASVVAALDRALAKAPADRFNPVAQFGEALTVAVPATAVRATASRSPTPGVVRLAIASVVVAAVAIGSWALATGMLRPSGPPRSAIVVLPFENLSSDREQQMFVDGLHDALIGELGQVAALHPISRTTAMNYGRSSGKTVAQIRDELKVGSLVEGSVLRVGDSVRIDVRLLDAATERPLWRREYDRPARAALGLLREVTSAVASEIGAQVSASESGRLSQAVAISAAAQDLFLAGRIAQYRRDTSGFRASVEAFSKAVQLEPRFAPAWAALANSYALAVSYGWVTEDSSYNAAAKSLALSTRALSLDASLAEAWAARGNLIMRSAGPPDSAESALRRAIALKPGLAEPHGWLGQLLAARGIHPEGRAEMTRALQLDPQAPGMRFGMPYVLSLGSDPSALDSIRVLAQSFPSAKWVLYSMAGELFLRRGDWAGCVASEMATPVFRATCLLKLGRTQEGAAEFERATQSGERSSRAYYERVQYLLAAGRTDDAIRAMQMHFAYTASAGFVGIQDPAVTEVWGAQVKSPSDPFGSAYTRMREAAWARIVSESIRTRIP